MRCHNSPLIRTGFQSFRRRVFSPSRSIWQSFFWKPQQPLGLDKKLNFSDNTQAHLSAEFSTKIWNPNHNEYQNVRQTPPKILFRTRQLSKTLFLLHQTHQGVVVWQSKYMHSMHLKQMAYKCYILRSITHHLHHKFTSIDFMWPSGQPQSINKLLTLQFGICFRMTSITKGVTLLYFAIMNV
jgi:hypothetical protein